MTPGEQKTYFSAIQEQLNSRNVVTFKWLSRKCKIHCTAAKQLLSEFLDDSDREKYSVNYIVFSKNSNGHLVISLSDESDLNSIAGNTTIVDKQIYSIECSSSDISTDQLYNEDKLTFQLEQMNLSCINYPTKIDKKPNVRRLISSSLNEENLNEERVVEKSASSGVKVEPKKGKLNKLDFSALPKSKNEEQPVNKTEDKSPKKSPVKTGAESKVSNVKTSKTPATSKGSLSALFQNHRVKNTSTSSGTTSKDDKDNEMKIEESEFKDKHDCSKAVKEDNCKTNSPVKRSSPVKAKKEKKTMKKSASKSKKKPEKKKRNRITLFESSSEESASDAEPSERESPFDQLEDEPEPEPESEKPVESKHDASVVPGKKRKREVVIKSAVGDDGFFYTEKEVVYVSCESDDNNENDPNENLEPNKRLKTSETENNSSTSSKTVVATPVAEKTNAKSQKAKTKQASIMNFFKKS